MDFASPVEGKMQLVVIDAHSKWPKILVGKNTTTEETVCTLRSVFACLGLPDQIVSDNGPQFTSYCFNSFNFYKGEWHFASDWCALKPLDQWSG